MEAKASDLRSTEADDKSAVGHAVADAWMAEAARLRGLLARLEWAGKYWLGDESVRECPACEAMEGSAHEPDCWLAAALGRLPGPVERPA
jgi:hypothetical protein